MDSDDEMAVWIFVTPVRQPLMCAKHHVLTRTNAYHDEDLVHMCALATLELRAMRADLMNLDGIA